MAVKCSGADAGLASDVVEGGFGSVYVKAALATSRMRSRLRCASARGLRVGGGGGSGFFGISKFPENFLEPETVSGYLSIRRQSPFYFAGAQMSTPVPPSQVAPPIVGGRSMRVL